jgi:hypothetical protein
MLPQATDRQIQWQDFKIRSEVDIVLEIAKQKGWKDCEIFGYGSMITQTQDTTGWKLIPADLYQYSIPPEGVNRVLLAINAGIRIQGVIIADDERRKVPPPAAPAGPKIPRSALNAVLSFIGKALVGLILLVVAIKFSPLVMVGAVIIGLIGAAVAFDPKLIILVDDGNGGTVWISLLTWYE